MRERDIEAQCAAWARNNGWLTYKFTSPAQAGVPDRLFIRGGRVVFVEFKRPGERPTTLQLITHRKMREHGAVVLVIDNVAAFKEALC